MFDNPPTVNFGKWKMILKLIQNCYIL